MYYIFQVILFQLLFLIVYELFFKRETFFNWNRGYLLLTPLLSLILPLIKIESIEDSIPLEYVSSIPSKMVNDLNKPASEILMHTEPLSSSFEFSLELFWWIGVIVSLLFFFVKLYRIYKLQKLGTVSKIDDYSVILLPKTDVAFSFFNTIYLGENHTASQQKNIIYHEKIHIQQWHSMDLLFFEILRIGLWFNPLIYIFQKRITILHEFIADSKVVQKINKKEYYQELLGQVFQTNSISFINPFFKKSLIKKRINMLEKSKSRKILQLKYLILIPIIGAMLAYTSSSSKSNDSVLENIEALKESIAAQGNISEEEENALKVLFSLTMDDGLQSSQFEDVKNLVFIPFQVVEKAPVFSGCSGDNIALNKCAGEKIGQLLGKEFNTAVAQENKWKGQQKIFLNFQLGLDGRVTNVKTVPSNPEMENEIQRIFATKFPIVKVGEAQGKKVGVLYEMPIVFEIK